MSRGRARTPITGVAIPRTRTPADEVLAAAIEQIRRDHPDWELAHVVTGALEQLAQRVADVEAARDTLKDTLRRLKAWAWGSAGTALVTVGTVLWFAFGYQGETSELRGAERQRAAQREARELEDREAADKLRDALELLARDHAALRGEVRGLYPLRALPVQGPRNRPDPTDQE